MNALSPSHRTHPLRWLVTLTLGAALAAAPALASAPPAHAVVTPVAVDDAYTTTQNSPISNSESAIANDTIGDASGYWTTLTEPKHGTVGVPDGHPGQSGFFKYQPEFGFSGTDSFQYCLSRGLAGQPCMSNIATVTITVLAARPVDDHFDTPAGVPLVIKNIDVFANDENVNPTYLGWTISTAGPANGALSGMDDGNRVTYTPRGGFTGTDSFSYCFAKSATGTACASPSATVFVDVGLRPTSRLSGADRFEVAVKVAQTSFPTNAPVVLVASGINYPDALSAGPAATKLGGPLLLTLPDQLPKVVSDEIFKLNPSRIIVVGGVNSVSDAVAHSLEALVPGVTVERVGGADRYAVSRAIADRAFGEVAHSYVATGANFPDALSAGAASGAAHEPVVLTNGGASSADAPTLALFAAHKTSGITIVGGPNSVSAGVESSLATLGTVTRAAGADRYEASSNLNHIAFSKADNVYLATGLNYPDALTGSVLAGMTSSPLYVVPPTCVPTAVLDDIKRLGATHVVLLGGPNSLSDDVAQLKPCA